MPSAHPPIGGTFAPVLKKREKRGRAYARNFDRIIGDQKRERMKLEAGDLALGWEISLIDKIGRRR